MARFSLQLVSERNSCADHKATLSEAELCHSCSSSLHCPCRCLCLRVAACAARSADPNRTLLLPFGGHYVGDFNVKQQQNGQGIEYHPDGKIAASGHWADGQLHGLGVTWGRTGKMADCGRFEHGRLVVQFPVPCALLPADPANDICQSFFTATGCCGRRVTCCALIIS